VMLSDPAVWGPALIGLVVYLSAKDIVAQLVRNDFRAADRHREIIEAFDSVHSDLYSINLDVGIIQTNTQPTSNDDD